MPLNSLTQDALRRSIAGIIFMVGVYQEAVYLSRRQRSRFQYWYNCILTSEYKEYTVKIVLDKENYAPMETDLALLAVVIPAYNEEKHIISSIKKTCELGVGIVVVVNDASSDRTKKILDTTMWDDTVHIIHHEVNRGKEGAIKTGLREALKFDHIKYFAFLDADMQIHPKILETLCERLKDYDVVMGVRQRSRDMPFPRRVANRLANLPYKVFSGIPVHDVQSGLRLYRRNIAEYLSKHLSGKGRYTLEHASFFLIGNFSLKNREKVRILEVMVPFQYGEAESNITRKDLLHLIISTFYYAARMGYLRIKGSFS